MSSPAYDPATLNFYEANARSYSSARPEEVCGKLLPFLGRLPEGSRILELGCGSGIDAAAMESMGFEVDATDGAEQMVALANTRLRKPARLLRFDDLDAVEEYDAVIAVASLLHIPTSALLTVCKKTWRALKPGGWHFATYKTAGTAGYDTHQRYYNYVSRAGAEQMYRAAGSWSHIEFKEYDGLGYFSAPCRWLEVWTRK